MVAAALPPPCARAGTGEDSVSVEQTALDRASTLRETAARPSQSRATPDTERVRAAAYPIQMLVAGGQATQKAAARGGRAGGACGIAPRWLGTSSCTCRRVCMGSRRAVWARLWPSAQRYVDVCCNGCSCVAARLAGVRGGLRRRRQRRQCTRRTRVRRWRRTVASDQFAASRTRKQRVRPASFANAAFGANPGHRAAAGGRARANRNKNQNSIVRRPLRALGVGRSRGPIPCSGRKRSSRTWPAVFTRTVLQGRSGGDGNLLV